ncbi:SPOR domain-containing protein [Armatimonas sp.]|uniref:SPOR domain-containing protein n=1 Tax=Armatimonas sp. TaxID=1872638 RepID=UPI00375386A0
MKWSLAAVGVVVVCFCLGYFVFGSKGGTPENIVVATPTPAPPPSLPVTMVDNHGLQVEDITAEKEADRKRREEAEKARLAAKLKLEQEQEQAKLVEPTPDPDVTATPDPDAMPTPDPDAMPTPEPKTTISNDPAKPAGEASKPEGEKPKQEIEKPKPGEEKTASKSLFRVRVGGPKASREDAEKLIAELRGQGYSPTIIADQRKGKTVFHVQLGAFSDAAAAERRKKELERNGHDVSVH